MADLNKKTIPYKKTINDIEGANYTLNADEQYEQEKLIANQVQEKKATRSWLSFFKSGALSTPPHVNANDTNVNKTPRSGK